MYYTSESYKVKDAVAYSTTFGSPIECTVNKYKEKDNREVVSSSQKKPVIYDVGFLLLI